MLRGLLPFLLVGAGSMIGGVSRYCMTLLTQGFSVFSIPYGTLAELFQQADCGGLVTLENIRIVHYVAGRGAD